MKKCIIILSGGMDSATLAYYLKDKGYELEAVSYLYGQKHSKEIECAKKVAEKLNIPHTIVDMFFLGSLLNSALTNTDEQIPEGHYEAENMKRTVVPNRNMMMATIAHAIGYSKGIKNIALGVHAGDHTVYPDCRPIFIEKLQSLLQTSNADDEIKVITPFLNIDKIDILRIGLKLDVIYGDTWTCYKGEEKPCGKCGSCVERAEAFAKCKARDFSY